MKLRWLLSGAALATASGWALAQGAPESLLPPGFDDPPPAPAAAPAPAPAPAPAARAGGTAAPSRPAATTSSPASVSGGAASVTGDPAGGPSSGASAVLAKLPTLDELAKMTPEEFEEALGLDPKFDIPAGARRAPEKVGLLDTSEGGLPADAMAGVRPSLLKRVLTGNRGNIVSRWGHILVRRALASRLDAPGGMNGADFAGLRAGLLVRMGEVEAARALVQDVDVDNYTAILTNAAFDAYVGTGDFTGVCPVLIKRRATREDPQWEAANDICSAARGDGRAALSRLDKALRNKAMANIDLLLAQRYAGAVGQSRRAVTIEWDDVDSISPWRYSLALALGIKPPDKIVNLADRRIAGAAALAPALGLADRAAAADHAAGRGILSSAAMVDLYGQIYSASDIDGAPSERAESLRRAYVLRDPAARSVAMQTLWNSAPDTAQRYSRQVLTAYAASRLPVDGNLAEQSGDLIASMLTAGLDRNAARWAGVVEDGSLGWALLAVGGPGGTVEIDSGTVDSFVDDDESAESRKSAFLVAGLAGLGRIDAGTRSEFEDRLELDLGRKSRWSSYIDRAASQDRQAMVALLAGLGMQGSGWDRMTARHLYYIVSALRRVGLEAEARMIAAEAVARG
ncbi:MAG: hypothetical protein KDE25_09315 [Novosphingobium sp.]|nr:hypothetical protein [Novosphingobium sp.]